MKRAAKIAAVVLLAAAFAYFIWPTPWVYYDGGQFAWRRNRFTGDVDMLYPSGWKRAESYRSPPAVEDKKAWAEFERNFGPGMK